MRIADGTPCDDGDRCTVDVCDPAGGACFNDPVFCDDGDPCTADLCDPEYGTCGSVPLDPADASDLRFLARYLLVCTAAPGPDHWNTCRGTIPSELLGSRRATYDHACFESADLAANGPMASVDFLDLPITTTFYYVVGGETACGDDAPGAGFAGQPRPVPFPCVTPPVAPLGRPTACAHVTIPAAVQRRTLDLLGVSSACRQYGRARRPKGPRHERRTWETPAA